MEKERDFQKRQEAFDNELKKKQKVSDSSNNSEIHEQPASPNTFEGGLRNEFPQEITLIDNVGEVKKAVLQSPLEIDISQQEKASSSELLESSIPETSLNGWQDIPVPVRDERGRIRWKLSNNTPEENEQLGIRNVQGLFLQKFPEFIDLFPIGEDGTILVERRKEAEEYILQQTQGIRNFTNAIHVSATNKNIAPYFEGNYQTVRKKSFKVWGLEFKNDTLFRDNSDPSKGRRKSNKYWSLEKIEEESLKFIQQEGGLSHSLLRDKKRLDLLSILQKKYPGGISAIQARFGISNRVIRIQENDSIVPVRSKSGNIIWKVKGNSEIENEQIAKRNIQGIFLENFSEFEQLFPRLENGLVEESKRREAALYIIEHIGKSSDFYKVFPFTIENTDSVPYFEGSYEQAIRKSFELWGIDFKIRDFNHEIWHGKTREEGMQLVKEIFIEEFPEFSEFLTEKGIVASEKVDEAKRYVLKKIPDRTQFVKIFGRNLLRTDPFLGLNSYGDILKGGMKPLGVVINRQDIKNVKDIWRNKTKDEQLNLLRQIFLDVYPQFKEQFLERDTIADNQTDAAIYILERVGKNRDFEKIFTGSSRANVPSFEGSIITALKKTFEPLGVEFRHRDFRSQNVWNNKTKEETLDLVLNIFMEEYPEFKLFLEMNREDVENNKIKSFILREIGTRKKFQKIFGTGPFQSHYSMFSDVVIETFGLLGITFEINDFDPRGGAWEKCSGEELLDKAQRLFIETFPESVNLLDTIRDKTQNVEELKYFILSVAGSYDKFVNVFPYTFLSERFPYFNKSYKMALQKIFQSWGVEFKDDDFPVVGRKSKVESEYIPPEEANEQMMKLLEE